MTAPVDRPTGTGPLRPTPPPDWDSQLIDGSLSAGERVSKCPLCHHDEHYFACTVIRFDLAESPGHGHPCGCEVPR